MSGNHAWTVDELARELDLIVFSLEQPPRGEDAAAMLEDRRVLRRKLEHLKQRLEDLAEQMMR